MDKVVRKVCAHRSTYCAASSPMVSQHPCIHTDLPVAHRPAAPYSSTPTVTCNNVLEQLSNATLTSTTALQVLRVLADPAHPDLQAKLRFAASAVAMDKYHNLPRWLRAGLLDHLLGILRALPTLHLSPQEAANTCAAAAAALGNVVQVALLWHYSDHPMPAFSIDSLMEKARSLDVLEAVVQFGMLGPAALQPLPAAIHIEQYPGVVQFSVAPAGDEPWTSLRVCGCLLVAVMEDYEFKSHCDYTACMMHFTEVLRPLVDTNIFQHLIKLALQHADGKLVPTLSATTPFVLLRSCCQGGAMSWQRR
jgi:hypothetical protein